MVIANTRNKTIQYRFVFKILGIQNHYVSFVLDLPKFVLAKQSYKARKVRNCTFRNTAQHNITIDILKCKVEMFYMYIGKMKIQVLQTNINLANFDIYVCQQLLRHKCDSYVRHLEYESGQT